MPIVVAALLALVFGLVASFLMTRASNFSPIANLVFGTLVVLVLAVLLFLIIVVAERVSFG